MKTDANDILREHGEDALRAALDAAAVQQRNGVRGNNNWQSNLRLAGKKPIPFLANVMVPLRDAIDLMEAFRFDEMLRMPIVERSLPAAKAEDWQEPRPVRDVDVSTLQEWLQREGLGRIGAATVYQAIELRAWERKFHPVRDYLNGLQWDGRERLPSWLTSYFNAQNTAYHSRRWPHVSHLNDRPHFPTRLPMRSHVDLRRAARHSQIDSVPDSRR